jgi:hypothetical protein
MGVEAFVSIGASGLQFVGPGKRALDSTLFLFIPWRKGIDSGALNVCWS